MSADGNYFVVTANTTDEGAPVYLKEDGSWTRALAEAATFDQPRAAERVKAAAKREREVCDPYSFEVRVEEGRIEPMSVRETIRSTGPTTRVRRPD